MIVLMMTGMMTVMVMMMMMRVMGNHPVCKCAKHAGHFIWSEMQLLSPVYHWLASTSVSLPIIINTCLTFVSLALIRICQPELLHLHSPQIIARQKELSLRSISCSLFSQVDHSFSCKKMVCVCSQPPVGTFFCPTWWRYGGLRRSPCHTVWNLHRGRFGNFPRAL